MVKYFRAGAIFGLMVLLGACSGNPSLEDRFAADPSLQNSPRVETSPTLSPSQNRLPDNFPDSLPRYEGAELVSARTDPDNPVVSTIWKTRDPSNLVESFYQQQLQAGNWEILAPFSAEDPNSGLRARRDNLEVKVAIVSTSPDTEFSLDYGPVETPTPQVSPSPVASSGPIAFDDLDRLPTDSRDHILDLARLGVLSGARSRFNPDGPISRRDFARWLVRANNALYANVPGKQIRRGNTAAAPVFGDLKTDDPDFPYIQGLAESGLIPSRLSGDSGALLFRPDALLTREELIAWKVPLDIRKVLPRANPDTIENSWGFQDAAKIAPKVARSLYADFQNGDSANVRRIYGYTTLFQPKRPVTRGEAAIALWYFGYQGEGLSAADALQVGTTGQENQR